MNSLEQQRILNQLKRIQGQIQGVARMVQEGRGMVPTVQQFLAVESAVSRSMRDYVSLFLPSDPARQVRLTAEQVEYLKRLIAK